MFFLTLFQVSGAEPENECSPMLPSDFFNVSMRRKVIGKIIFPALNSSFIFKSYKVMPVAQNSHAYVNAAFLLQLNESRSLVQSAKICFGGICENFIHAEKLEKYLVGKNIYDNEIFKSAVEILSKDVEPEASLAETSVGFRKYLAISLFYKFVLKTAPVNKVKSEFKTGAELLKRELSKGFQEIEANEGKSKLYKQVKKFEGDVQCTGEAQYINDIPKFQKELHAAFVLGEKVHGRIASIDASEALKIPGVVAFYGAKDIPGINNFMPLRFDFFNKEVEEIFCSDKLLYHGQPVGILLAESFDLAYKARDFVKVSYTFDSEGAKC